MRFLKMGLLIRALLIAFSFSFLTMGEDAFARAGSKRSFGQRSQPTAQPRNPPPQQQVQPAPNRGGFMKGLAGGLAGGLIGSMLFSSLAHGSGMGGGSGGIGLFEIILFAGLAFVAYRFWKSRQQNRHAFAGAAPLMGASSMGYNPPMAPAPMARSASYGNGGSSDVGYFAPAPTNSSYPLSGTRLDRETAEDVFFRVQGAWTRRDLTSVEDFVERDVARVLQADLEDLKSRHEINRLENISVRNIEISEPWMEGDRELVRVRFTASLLDYTVDESTSAIKSGSNSEPVKFDEYWVFAKSQGRSSWQLAGIEQI